ncbi:MAG: hypothetical protein CVV05_01145 [Gammaproteobacteria bacterium HGW-Gammaproteobacteria-1]|jgi:hypothetical protein|nr:MAG: hypothetical protein CVV05_01145 [Gammaproteobacteria bacterium HGW-Gammaproteobacteria-1]
MTTQINVNDVVAAKLGQIITLKHERRDAPPQEFERSVLRICGEQALRREMDYTGPWPVHALMIHQALASPLDNTDDRSAFWRYLVQDWLPQVREGLDAPMRPDREGRSYTLPQCLIYLATRDGNPAALYALLDRHVPGWREGLAQRWREADAGVETLRDTFSLSMHEEISFLENELPLVHRINKHNAMAILLTSIRAGGLGVSTPKELYVKVLTSGLRLDDSLREVHALHGSALPSVRTVGKMLDGMRRQYTQNPVFATWEALFLRARLCPSGETVGNSQIMPSL